MLHGLKSERYGSEAEAIVLLTMLTVDDVDGPKAEAIVLLTRLTLDDVDGPQAEAIVSLTGQTSTNGAACRRNEG